MMADKPLILAVNHNRRNLELLAQFLDGEGYQTLPVASLEEYDQALSERASSWRWWISPASTAAFGSAASGCGRLTFP